MDEIWSRQFRVRSSDVTKRRVLRLSTLLRYIQEGTVRHTTELGMGRDMTLDRGLLWVITQQHLTVKRLPGYDEVITLKTWPGASLHLFFPRYTSVLDAAGEELIHAKTLWVLMDEKVRRPVFPQKYGVHIEGVSQPGDFPLPRVALPKAGDRLLLEKDRTALFSECDINGHMNNSLYFDLFDDMMQECMAGRSSDIDVSEISAEYIDEIPYGFRYTASLYQSEEGYLLLGTQGDRSLFRIRLICGKE